MVREVATSASRVVCVVGLAGAGKTTATHAVAQVFAHDGVPVLGAAPSGVAAEKLQDETGIPSMTLHRCSKTHARRRVAARERRSSSTRPGWPRPASSARCSNWSSRPQGKAILIGDPHQLPAVGAGGLFAGIVERHGAVELTENRRQHDELERDALARVRDGVGRDYLAYAEKRERLVVSESPVTTRTRLLADWWEHARDDLAGNVMLALRRRDVADLNAARPRADGHATAASASERLTVSDREFAAGDRIVCLRNSDALGVKNGTRGTVERVDRDRRTLDRSTDRGPTVELSRRYLEAGNVRHAYALTGHAAQGLTVERAFVLGTGEARLQEWGYVALSRARTETRLYVTGDPREHESHFHDLDDRDPLTRFGRALEESAVEQLAVDQRPLPSGPGTRLGRRSSASRRARMTSWTCGLSNRSTTRSQTRQTAEEKLRAAERELTRTGPLRRRRRDDLRAEVGLLHHADSVDGRRLIAIAALIEDARLEARGVGGQRRDCRRPQILRAVRHAKRRPQPRR